MFRVSIDKQGMQMLYVLLMLYSLFFSSCVQASEGIVWMKQYGGSGDDVLYSSIKTLDNCILLVGKSNSFTDTHYEIYVVKIDQNGELLWSKTYGDEVMEYDDAGYSAIETSDGYLITGKIVSEVGIGDDVFLLKIDHNGNKKWIKNYGGNAWDWGNDLLQNPDNSIIILGTTQDFAFSYYETLVIKTDANGNELWRRAYEDSGHLYPSSIIRTPDNNYLITGTATDGTNKYADVFVLKIDANGNSIWFKKYGGINRESGNKIIQTSDGYVVIGSTNSMGSGKYDIYLIKIDNNGNVMWETTIGSPEDDHGYHIQENSEGMLIATGGTFRDPSRSMDLYLAILSSEGNVTYEKTYGTEQYDCGIATHLFSENIYYITSNLGSRNHNFYVVKISLQPFELILQSQFGDTFGMGTYYFGSIPIFGVTEETVYVGTDIRYIFEGWESTQNGGYTGPNNPAQISIQNDVTQTAIWQKQYYVRVNVPAGSTASEASGWFNEGELVKIYPSIDYGLKFNKWEGEGLGSYTGNNLRAEITINGPITQTLVLDTIPIYQLDVHSEFSKTVGSGEYYEGSWVDFDINLKVVYLDNYTRYVFEKWSSYSENGYNGNDCPAKIRLLNDVTQDAVWKKQYYVNVSCNLPNVDIFESGWYDEGKEIQIFCEPYKGYKFSGWLGEGIGSYSGAEKTFSLFLESSIVERASITIADSYVLRIISEYGSVPESTLYYEDTNAILSIGTDIIYLSNNTRARFNGWKAHSNDGYTGDEKNVTITITSDIVEEAIWVKQYYVSSTDSSIELWKDEDTILELPLNTSGLLIPVSKVYKVGSSVIEESILIDRPTVIQVSTRRSYLNVIILAILTTTLGTFYQYRSHRLTLVAKKSEIMKDVLRNDSLSLIDIASVYDLSYTKANAIATELGKNEKIIYDLRSLTLYTNNGMAKSIKNTLYNFGEIEFSRLQKILEVKDDILYSVIQSDNQIIIENNRVKLN